MARGHGGEVAIYQTEKKDRLTKDMEKPRQIVVFYVYVHPSPQLVYALDPNVAALSLPLTGL